MSRLVTIDNIKRCLTIVEIRLESMYEKVKVISLSQVKSISESEDDGVVSK